MLSLINKPINKWSSVHFEPTGVQNSYWKYLQWWRRVLLSTVNPLHRMITNRMLMGWLARVFLSLITRFPCYILCLKIRRFALFRSEVCLIRHIKPTLLFDETKNVFWPQWLSGHLNYCRRVCTPRHNTHTNCLPLNMAILEYCFVSTNLVRGYTGLLNNSNLRIAL